MKSARMCVDIYKQIESMYSANLGVQTNEDEKKNKGVKDKR